MAATLQQTTGHQGIFRDLYRLTGGRARRRALELMRLGTQGLVQGEDCGCDPRRQACPAARSMDGEELSSWALVGSLLAGGVLAVAAKSSLCSPALPLGPVASSHGPEEPEKPSGKTWAESLLSFLPWPACSRLTASQGLGRSRAASSHQAPYTQTSLGQPFPCVGVPFLGLIRRLGSPLF